MNAIPQDQKLEEILERAKHDASQGSVYGAKNYLNEARRFAAEAGLEIPEATLQSIEQNAYRFGINVALERAKRDVSQGSVYGAENYLNEARRFAAKIVGDCLDISERVQEIESMLRK